MNALLITSEGFTRYITVEKGHNLIYIAKMRQCNFYYDKSEIPVTDSMEIMKFYLAGQLNNTLIFEEIR